MLTKKPKCAYHLQSGSGNACAGDPPGHPRYYSKSVYTAGGNSFHYEKAPQYFYNGRFYTELDDINKFFKPLPLDHPRTRGWILDKYRHHANCYYDKEKPEYGRPGTLIYPVGTWELETFQDDKRFSDAWREKERASVTQKNKEIREYAEKVAKPENHQAVILIREYYPHYQPELELIKKPPVKEGRGHWWETLSTRPTRETCPGESRWANGSAHPVNGSWCQVCGYDEPKEVAAK